MVAYAKKRVKLTVDLTQYDSRLVVNELGWTVVGLKCSMWGYQDRFTAVQFDNGALLDILWKSLKVIE